MTPLLIPFLIVTATPAPAGNNSVTVESLIDENHQDVWNRFADGVLDLHRQRLAGRKVRTEEQVGRYGGEMARRYRYRETRYFDADSGRLLGVIRSDHDRPQDIQLAEVYVYDQTGRVERDYAFIYLPWGRAAPIRTFINLHHYSNGLHAWRQFDASGIPTYESCEGTHAGKAVSLEREDGRVGEAGSDADLYRRCFDALPSMAGHHLRPH